MGLDYKLILDELDKLASRFERHFDSREAKRSKFPSVGAPEAKVDGARETSVGVTADNWGGHFDGGDDLDTVISNTASVESVGFHDVPVPIQSAVFGAGMFANNWGGLFDGGDDLNTTVSNTASAESIGLHDVPACDPVSFDLDTAVSITISIELVSSDGTKRDIDRPLADPVRVFLDQSHTLLFPIDSVLGWIGERDSSWPIPSPGPRSGTAHGRFLEFLRRGLEFHQGEQPSVECVQPVR
jgi:hypothetical protein